MSDKTTILRKVISNELCEFLSLQFRILMIVDYGSGLYSKPANDSELFSKYSPLFLDSLLLYLQPLIQENFKDRLLPTYSFGRIYGHQHALPPHFDCRSSSEIGVSCCLSKDSEWSLDFYKSDKIESVSLEIGDVVIYHGPSLKHGRAPYCGQEYIGAFLFYVFKNGPLKHLRYDTRPFLGCPLPRNS